MNSGVSRPATLSDSPRAILRSRTEEYRISRNPDDVLNDALALPLDARARLAESLLSSLDEAGEDADAAALEQEWLAEVARRAADIDAGRVRTIPATEVFRAAREELRMMQGRRARGA